MRIGFFLFCAYLIAGCGNAVNDYSYKSKALGIPGQLTVICDEVLWSTPFRDTVETYLSSYFPVLPRPEPLFDIRTFTPFDLRTEEVRKELRTYLVCASGEDTSSSSFQLMKKHLGPHLDMSKSQLNQTRDLWATDQLVLYYFAPTDSAMYRDFHRFVPVIIQRVQNHDREPILAKTYLKGESKSLTDTLGQKFDIHLKVPQDYVVAKSEDNFIWLRKDVEDMTTNILIYEVPYLDTSQLSPSNMTALLNTLGREHVQTHTPGSFLRINGEELPVVFFHKEIQEHFALQAKGLWEMTEDFMGGPFVGYLIVREDRGSLLLFDAFVLAPGHKKRNIMLGLENLIESTTF